MIRHAVAEDFIHVVHIYNQAVSAGFQTAFTEPFVDDERRKWFAGHLGRDYPILVHESGGKVNGWLSISPYREGRPALNRTVELSYFVDEQSTGIGIGTLLMAQGLEEVRVLGYKVAIAVILDRNAASIRLARNFGFEQWGYLPEVAAFGGETCGQYYFGKIT